MKNITFNLPMVDEVGELTELGKFVEENGIDSWSVEQISILYYCWKFGYVAEAIDLVATPELWLGKNSNVIKFLDVKEFINVKNNFPVSHNQLVGSLYAYNQLVKLEQKEQIEVCLFYGIDYELVQQYIANRDLIKNKLSKLIKESYCFNTLNRSQYSKNTPEILHVALLVSNISSIEENSESLRLKICEEGGCFTEYFIKDRYKYLMRKVIDDQVYYAGVMAVDIRYSVEWMPHVFTMQNINTLTKVRIPELGSTKDMQVSTVTTSIIKTGFVVDVTSSLIKASGDNIELADFVREVIKECIEKLSCLSKEDDALSITLIQEYWKDELCFKGSHYQFCIEDMQSLAADVTEYVDKLNLNRGAS